MENDNASFLTDIKNELGEKLRQIRRKKRKSQREVSVDLSYRRSMISEIENGTNNPSFLNVLRLAAYYGIDSARLFGESDKVEEKVVEQFGFLDSPELQYTRLVNKARDERIRRRVSYGNISSSIFGIKRKDRQVWPETIARFLNSPEDRSARLDTVILITAGIIGNCNAKTVSERISEWLSKEDSKNDD